MPATQTTARRHRRIASDEAHAWARHLRLRNPFAKAILLALCLYVDSEGACFVGIEALAEDTDLSPDTVRKRLRFLEEIGAIVRLPRWRDENGRVNVDGRGKRTTDEIRLRYDADPEEIEARAHGNADTETAPQEPEAVAVSPRHQQGLNPAQPSASPLPAPEQPSHCSKGLTPEREQEDSNPKPLPQAEGALPDAAHEEAEATLRQFASVYPSPISDWLRAFTVWKALSGEERQQAITGARGYAAMLKSKPDRPANDAHRWLAGRKWLGYLVAGKEREVIAERFDSPEGSDEWVAWEIYYRACGKIGLPEFLVAGSPGNRVFNAPSRWPPVGRGLDPDRSKWTRVIVGTGQFAAWRRRLLEIPNAQLSTRDTRIDGVFKAYLEVPCEWPPPKSDEQAA